MYKNVLVILHDSILPHMSKPTLMIDFLTAAYEVGMLCMWLNSDNTGNSFIWAQNENLKITIVVFYIRLLFLLLE